MSDNEPEDDAGPAPYPRDVELLLRKIEREPVPEKLLALAIRLQTELAKRQGHLASDSTTGRSESVNVED